MDILETLREDRLLAIVRGTEADSTHRVAEVLIESGFTALEIPLTTPDAVGIIGRLVRAHGPDVAIGGGTVLTAVQAAEVAEAGGTFVVTPALCESVDESARLGLPSLVGVLTPSEVIAALERGAAAVKLFPAQLGGPEYLAALRAPLPDVKFIPVGGVGLTQVSPYLARGAFALGIGGPLVGDALSGGSLSALRDRAAAFLREAAVGARAAGAGRPGGAGQPDGADTADGATDG